MMMSEFIERTNYTPDDEEYGFIEDAYYEFEGNKDEFCKWWLKARRGGYWEREYTLRRRERQMYDELSRASVEYKQEVEETLDFYRNRTEEQGTKIHQMRDALLDAEERCDELEDRYNDLQYKYESQSEELFSVHHQYDTLMDALSVIKTALM